MTHYSRYYHLQTSRSSSERQIFSWRGRAEMATMVESSLLFSGLGIPPDAGTLTKTRLIMHTDIAH